MLVDGFKKLRINWYVTHDIDFVDCPMELETELIKRWNPRWNIRQVEPPNKKL
ncbi:hypothetical protein SMI01S_16020 [Sphingobacterium mizutaii NBRC 14946 = DSM 11724]|uniref:Uncharacterized protein n=2 Tax=Sphingobacterium mizutaii TaxID=1010 RepID=A0AAJ4X858_9SPHI|nr:hypothetical protein SMI01S_16020 [Sphingobacterium mizutaii NBRC 14946 = DSM 11724]SDL78902.1 hypothetical protein SAMN05192578_10988 [Sphingobacterium mizutaii]SNV37539.1 Uncharacterised protein [Sphingobacterium mizutaii]